MRAAGVDILITAPIEPIGKGRPRARAFLDKNSGRPVATIYTPKDTAHWEHDFAAIVAAYCPAAPLEGPLRVDILAVFARPQRLLRRSDPSGLLEYDGRIDADNVRKIVLDAMKAFWRDDKQVICGQTLMGYAEKAANVRTIVRIRDLAPGSIERMARDLGLLAPAENAAEKNVIQLELTGPVKKDGAIPEGRYTAPVDY